MDELDFLLEELSQTSQSSAGPGTAPPMEDRKSANERGGQVSPFGAVAVTTPGPEEQGMYSVLQFPKKTPMSPNSAAKELDSIMQQLLGLDVLSDLPSPSTLPVIGQKSGSRKGTETNSETGESLKGSDPDSDRPAPTGKMDAIDDLLGGLSSDMEKMGVHTATKGHCASCGKCIVGKMITALGEVWHPEHFTCVVCHLELGAGGFFERDGKAYCEQDYQHLFSPSCSYCKGPILQNILSAMDQTWHPEHFFCAACGKRFGPEGFLEKEGKPYCPEDFHRLFAPKCSGCGEPVRENYLSAANGTWHPQCFVCTDCLKPFSDGSFLDLDGQPFCPLHYHSRQGMLCAGCGQPISGRCVAALGQRFHPEHFVCAFCLRQLSQGVFQERAGKPYCSACHAKLFL